MNHYLAKVMTIMIPGMNRRKLKLLQEKNTGNEGMVTLILLLRTVVVKNQIVSIFTAIASVNGITAHLVVNALAIVTICQSIDMM